MLGVPVDVVRTAVEHLANEKELTAETFVYGQRSWRVAPSDVKRLQDWIQSGAGEENLRAERPRRRIKRKQRVVEEHPGSQ